MIEKKSLPTGWKWQSLDSLSRVFMGGTAPQNKNMYAKNGIPFFRVSDLSIYKRTLCLTQAKDHIALEHTSKLHLVKAKKGAVIFPKSGAAVATNNRGILGVDGYVVSHLMVLEAKKDIVIPEWLYWSLCQIDMMEYNGNISYPALQKTVVGKIKIPLPPLKEQKRITSLLKQQMSAAEKARIAAEEKLSTVLLLSSALIRDAFITDKVLPKGWIWAKLGDVIRDIKDGGTPPRNNPNNFGGAINWCVVKDIQPEIKQTKESLSEDGLKNCSAKVWPIDSIIISLGATIGNVGIAKIPVATKQGLSGIIVDAERITSQYLYYVLLHQKSFINSLAGGTTIKEVRPSKLKSALVFPLPPLPKQKQIVSLLEQQMLAVEKSRIAAEEELQAIRDLPAALLRKVLIS